MPFNDRDLRAKKDVSDLDVRRLLPGHCYWTGEWQSRGVAAAWRYEDAGPDILRMR